MSADADRADGADSGDLDAAMAGFRDRARATNLSRVEVIAEALRAMRDGALPEEVRLTSRAAAHSLAGSAGTFGFAEASELGRALETLLEAVEGAVEGTDDLKVRGEHGWQLVTRLRTALSDPAVDAPASAAGEDSP